MADEKEAAPAAEKKTPVKRSISLVVDPAEVVGVELEPVYISFGINQTKFKKEVGGTKPSA